MLTYEPWLRIAAFGSVFALLTLWEVLAPRRTTSLLPRRVRWTANLGLVALNTLFVRIALPTTAVAFADRAAGSGIGLFAASPLPYWLVVALSVVLLDFAIYLQHVLFHAVPVLWRLHRVHHSDVHVDASTGVRFHTAEIALSLGLKLAVIAAIGAPAIAVLVFEVLLNATSMFNHANVRLPSRLDAVLRWLVVTPDMHRVHHSVHRDETDSNFGFNLPWWDRLFGTYRKAPRDGHETMQLGIPLFRKPQDARLDRLLVQPLE